MQKMMRVSDLIQVAGNAAYSVLNGDITISCANSTARNLEAALELIKAEIIRERLFIESQQQLKEIGSSSIAC